MTENDFNAQTTYSEVIINETKVSCPLRDGMVLVPIKPICEALGIDSKSQREVIKNHPIWSSVEVLSTSTGADGKEYQMLCLPLKYVFGWLMGIDARLVNPGASDALVRYQEAAYDALYDRFFLEPAMQKRKLMILLEKENAILMMELQKRRSTTCSSK